MYRYRCEGREVNPREVKHMYLGKENLDGDLDGDLDGVIDGFRCFTV